MDTHRPWSTMDPISHGPVPDTLSQTSEIPNVSSIHDSQNEIYQAYHPSLGPPQPSDLWQPYEPPSGPPPGPHAGKEETVGSPSSAPEVAENFGFYHPQPQQGHRAMSPTLSQGSTNIGSPQLGTSTIDGQDKEVAHIYSQEDTRAQQKQKKRICGLAAKLFWILLALLLLLLIGLGVGLGAGLGIKKHNASSQTSAPSASPTSSQSGPTPTFTGDPNYNIGGVINPTYYSKKGAFNGSGIAFAGAALKTTSHGLYTIYYQHYAGTIRSIQLGAGNTFEGGTQSDIVAYDAKNSTPISVVQYVFNETAEWHVFYVGNDSYVKQRTWTNLTSRWTDGPATAQNFKVYDSDSVGLQACWYGSFYGDTATKDFPTPTGAAANNVSFYQKYGMNLWYPSDENTFQQYGIYEGLSHWTFEKKWAGFNTHAGVGCYSWLPGSTEYAMFVNTENAVEIWWKDIDSNLTSTEEHPINAWVNATDAYIPNVYPSTSLGFTTFLYAMLDDSTIHGYNISWSAEKTLIWDNTTVTDGTNNVKFLNGTHMTVSAVGESLLVFAQTKGDDITMYTRPIDGGIWTSVALTVDVP